VERLQNNPVFAGRIAARFEIKFGSLGHKIVSLRFGVTWGFVLQVESSNSIRGSLDCFAKMEAKSKEVIRLPIRTHICTAGENCPDGKKRSLTTEWEYLAKL
jgi:hypothetical protein